MSSLVAWKPLTPEPVAVPVADIRQPSANGEFASPVDGALWMALTWGIKQIPIAPRKKTPLPGFVAWETKASVSPDQIRQWAQDYPGCNFASVASDTHIILEVDVPDPKPEGYQPVAKRYRETAKAAFSSKLAVMSSTKERGHRYYLSVPGFTKTVSQSDVKFNDFSVRVGNAYCVSPGSVHPSGALYRVIINETNNWPSAPEKPTRTEIDFWLSEKKSDSREKFSDDSDAQIPEGARNTMLTSIAGTMRQKFGWEGDELKDALEKVRDRRCPEFPDSEIDTIVGSISKYPDGVNQAISEIPLIGGVLAGTRKSEPQVERLEVDRSTTAARPEFPRWVLEGTSLYEGFAKPVSEANSKYPEVLWVPAVQVMLNYLQGNVYIEGMKNLNLNMYVGIVSPPGKFFKSSSCKLGHKYFTLIDVIATASSRASQGRVVVTQAGSSEGLGIRMQQLNASHVIFFSDELTKLAAKAGIENSSLPADLLSWYESDDFSNNITSKKSQFCFPAGTYLIGWQFCTTTGGFDKNWTKLVGMSSGLGDRMLFLLTPKEPKALKPEVDVNFIEGALLTKQRITDAFSQIAYPIVDKEGTAELSAIFGDPRSMNLVYKLALYFAVDLGRPEIDEDCVERAMALVQYRQQSAAFLDPLEAENQEARLQLQIVRVLKRHAGSIGYRELCRELNSSRYGSTVWFYAYNGLIKNETIFEAKEQGNHGQTKRVVYLRKFED